MLQVFELDGVQEKLESVGMSSATVAQFTKLLVELDLLSEGHVSNLLTVSEKMDKVERRQLAEQLYTYLVYWLGEFYNDYVLIHPQARTSCLVLHVQIWDG